MNFHKVFVYGTLKKGEPNHSQFCEGGGIFKYLGMGQTILKYPLIIGTKYNIPFLLFSPGKGNNVLGEIYEVDDKCFSSLDLLEDHPNFYEREIAGIKSEETGDTLECWVYFIKKFRPSLLDNEMLTSYSTFGPHNLPYCESNNESTFDDLN